MCRVHASARGSRMLLQHIFRAYARRIGIDGQRIGLKFISRRSKRPAKSVIPLLRSFRMLFRSFGVRRAIRRPCVSCILPRCNSSSTRSNPQPPYFAASWPRCGFAFDDQTPGAPQFLSVRSVYSSFSPLLTLGRHTCTKSKSGKRLPVSTIIYGKAVTSRERQYLLDTFSDRCKFPRQSRNL